MDITNIRSQTSAVNLANAKPGGQLGKDEFLRLLVAQLQNQDPINPKDGAEFATQLAQFNSVEQLINLNEGISQLQFTQELMGTGLSNTLASTLTGKTVRATSNRFEIEEGKPMSPVRFNLANDASEVTVTVRDRNGTVVRTEVITNKSSGDHSWEWNGKNEQGVKLPPGSYTISVSAKQGDATVNASPFVMGTVNRVRYSSDGVQLLVNGIPLSLGDVDEIGDTP